MLNFLRTFGSTTTSYTSAMGKLISLTSNQAQYELTNNGRQFPPCSACAMPHKVATYLGNLEFVLTLTTY